MSEELQVLNEVACLKLCTRVPFLSKPPLERLATVFVSKRKSPHTSKVLRLTNLSRYKSR